MKIDFRCEIAATSEQIERNVAAARALNRDFADAPKTKRERLAVVGGGPSINRNVNALRNWKGDVWAINGAAKWCDARKIKAALFSLDPSPLLTERIAGCRARKAILATQCEPSAYAAMAHADIITFDLDERGIEGLKRCLPAAQRGMRGIDEFMTGWDSFAQTSSASATAPVAIALGYREITFFGCEGSFEPNKTHAYMNEADQAHHEYVVACNGQRFLTRTDYAEQAKELAGVIGHAAGMLKERSGGLLRALIANPNDDIIGASPGMVRTLQFDGASEREKDAIRAGLLREWNKAIGASHEMGVEELMSRQHAELIAAAPANVMPPVCDAGGWGDEPYGACDIR